MQPAPLVRPVSTAQLRHNGGHCDRPGEGATLCPMTLDINAIRKSFPALATEWALMDNAGGSVAPRQVIDRIVAYMSKCYVQFGASYPLSVESEARVEAGRRSAALLIGAEQDEIVLGASTTANVAMLARSLRPLLSAGDEVVVTNLDHEANIGAWRQLAEHGIVIREWRVDPISAQLRFQDLEPLLGPRTRLVCFTHCSNLVGAIHDVAELTRRIHDAGAWVAVDGVAFAPHRLVDVKDLGVDFYFVSLYKVYGPHQGLMYGRRELLELARSQNHFWVGEDQVPYKFQPGNVNYELAAGVPGIVEYLSTLAGPTDGMSLTESLSDTADARAHLAAAFDGIAAHEEALAAPVLAWLDAKQGVHVIGPVSADRALRAPTISFHVQGRPSSAIPPQLAEHGIGVRSGHMYAPRGIEALGLDKEEGVVRISLAHYNTFEEVERLIAALDAVL